MKSVNWTDRSWNRLILMCLLVAVWACADDGAGCDIDSCLDCDGEGPSEPTDPYPAGGPILPGGVEIKVTQGLFDTITENLEPILAEALGDEGLEFCIPETDVVVGTLCRNNADCTVAACNIELELGPASIDLAAPNQVSINASVPSFDQTLPLRALGCNCNARVRFSSATFSLPLFFDVDGPLSRTRLLAGEPDVNINGLSIGVSGSGILCGAACGTVGIGTAIFGGLFGGFISDAVAGPVEELLADLPEEIGAEGVLDLSDVLGGLVGGLLGDDEGDEDPEPAEPTDPVFLSYLFYLGSYANASTGPAGGLDLGALAGFTAEPSFCVPALDPPPLAPIPPAVELQEENPAWGLGVALHRYTADLALWAVHRSGLLCLEIDGNDLDLLTTDTFGLLLPSLGRLSDGVERPLRIALRPNQAPYVTFGDTAADLLQLRLDNAEVDFFIFAFDRWTRVFTVDIDVAVGLGLEVTDSGGIAPVIGDLSQLIARFDASNTQLMNPAEIEVLGALLPAVIDLLLPGLTDDLLDLEIEIPELLGFRVDLGPNAFRAIDNNDRLGVFAGLTVVDPDAILTVQATPVARIVQEDLTFAAPGDARRHLDAVHAGRAAFDAGLLMPRVRLTMASELAGSPLVDAEYSYRVNGGMWSVFQPGPVIEVDAPQLALNGVHVVDVRARIAGERHSVGSHYERIEIVNNYLPPHLRLSVDELALRVDARDAITPREALEMRSRINAGSWSAWRPGVEDIDLSSLAGARARVAVEVRDDVGNTTLEELDFVVPREIVTGDATPLSPGARAHRGVAPTTPLSPAVDEPRAGCAAAGGSAGGFGIGVLLLALVALRRRLGLIAAIGALFFLGACSSDLTIPERPFPTCEEDEDCDSGRCVGGVCLPDIGGECLDDENCPDGAVCERGVCVADTTGTSPPDTSSTATTPSPTPTPTPTDDPECFQDADCALGDVCDAGSCVPEPAPTTGAAPACTVDNECPRGAFCDEGSCAFGAGRCAEDDDCASGEFCSDSFCLLEDECEANEDCPLDFLCVDGGCQRDPAAPDCREDLDCGSGLVCEAEICVPAPECEANEDCPLDFLCEAGSCVPDPAAPDCREDVDCGAGDRCEAGACVRVTDCSTNAECGRGFVCVEELCTIVRCSDDTACPEGTFCRGAYCAPDDRCVEDDDCPGDEICDDRTCVSPVCVVADDCKNLECAGDQEALCVNGTCLCELPCPAGCADGAYCCFQTNRCRPLPWACETLSCPPGTVPTEEVAPVANSRTCMLESPGVCTCEPRPPLDMGSFGRWLNGASNGERVALVTYNETFGDLMFGFVDEEEGVDWEIVDGVPADGRVTGDPEGFRGGISERGPDVGRHPAVALAADGSAHVIYEASSGPGTPALRYARRSPAGTWTITTLREDMGSAAYTAIDLLSDGRPVIMYHNRVRSDGPTALELSAAAQIGIIEDGELVDWARFQSVDNAAEACNGPCGAGRVCNATTQRCTETVREAWCGGCDEGERCFREGAGFVCAPTDELSGPFTLPERGVGLFNALVALEGDVVIAMTHAVSSSRTFMTALRVPDELLSEQGYSWIAPEGANLRFARLFLDADGSPRAVALNESDRTLEALIFGSAEDLVFDSDVANPNLQGRTIIDDGLRVTASAVEQRLVGAAPVLFEADGVLHAVYQDASAHQLLLAARLDGTDNDWGEPEVLIGEPDQDVAYGFYTFAGRDETSWVVATERVDNSVNPPRRDVVLFRPGLVDPDPTDPDPTDPDPTPGAPDTDPVQ